VPADQREHPGRGTDRGEQLAAAAGAELGGERRGKQGDTGGGQGRGQPQRDEVVAEQRGEQPGQRRRADRLVDVADGQMPAEQPEVELVAVVAVPGGEREQRRDQYQGDRQQSAPDSGVGRVCGGAPSIRGS
jgi:hypothetical protein